MWNKQLDLHHVTKEMNISVLFILKTVREGTFSPKKREVGKIVEEGCLGRVTYVCC